MKNKESIFTQLNALAQMNSTKDIEEFEKLVWELAATKDPIILDQLIQIFYEECPFREVMYNVVHAIETYPDEVYVLGILRNMKTLIRTPSWAKTLLYGIFNSPKCLKLFKSNILISDNKSLSFINK